MKRFSILMILIFLSSFLMSQSESLDIAAKLPLDPTLKKGVLKNGFTYYIKKNTYPEKKLELRLVVNAGSVLENDAQQGLAHFLEHMNFNGTEHFKKNQLVTFLQSIGVSFGADLNAYTSFDETVYILPIPTTDSNNIEKGFQIMQDWSHLALLTKKDIDDERNVVLEESRMRKGVQDRIIRKLLPAMFEGSVYANRLPIGQDSILKNFVPAVLKDFHTKWYQPHLTALVVVGDIDEKKAAQLVEKYFSNWTLPENQKSNRPVINVLPMQKNKGSIFIDEEQPTFSVAVEFSPIQEDAEIFVKDYQKGLIKNLIQIIFNLRLGELEKSVSPPFLNAGIGIEKALARHHSNLSLYASIGNAGLEKGLLAVIEEVKKGLRFGFSESELQLAKKQIYTYMENAYKEKDKTKSSQLVGELIRNYLEQEPIPGIENEFLYVKYFLPKITLADLQKTLQSYIGNQKFFTYVIAPQSQKNNLPSENELVKMVEEYWSRPLLAETKKEFNKKILYQLPTAGSIISESQDTNFQSTNFVLSNGMKVYFKNTNFKEDEVMIKLIEKGGTYNFESADQMTLKYLPQSLENMGWGDLDPSDLQKILADKKVSVGLSIDPYNHGLNISSSLKDIETACQLFYLKLMQPKIDTNFFNSFIQKQKSTYQFILKNPQASFADTFAKVKFQNHPYFVGPVPHAEDFDKINLKQIQKIYPSFWHQFSNASLFVVGSIQIDSLKPLLEKYFASLPNNTDIKTSEWKDVGMRPLRNDVTLTHKKGTDPKSLLIVNLFEEKPFEFEKANALELLETVLETNLIDQIREKNALVYTLKCDFGLVEKPFSYFSGVFQFPCAPENVSKVLESTWKEISKVQRDNGISQSDLEKAQKQYIEHLKEATKTNAYWLNSLTEHFYMNISADRILNKQDYILKITPQNLKTVASEYLKKSNSFNAILYPENK